MDTPAESSFGEIAPVNPQVQNVDSIPQLPSPAPKKRMLWKWSLAGTAVVLAFFMWQCGWALHDGRDLSVAAANNFHADLNEGNFQQIYEGATEEFQSAGSKEDTLRLFQAVHKKLGFVMSSYLQNITVNATTSGTFVRSIHRTAFEHGSAIETFTWKKSGGRLILYNYNINSKELIIN